MDIRISQLTFAYPNRRFRLHIPELEINRGAHVAFVGPSGSGKTTLLRLLAGIYLPETGRLTLDSMELSELNDAARRAFRITRIGFVFQDFQLIDYLDVAENIRLPYRIHRAMKWTDHTARHFNDLVDATGMADKLKRPIVELSHGERQRVAICRALLTEPGLVLADEPTGNLDPASKHRILDLLFDQTRRRGATLVMVTHDRDLLEGFDQVIDFQRFAEACEPSTARAGGRVVESAQ